MIKNNFNNEEIHIFKDKRIIDKDHNKKTSNLVRSKLRKTSKYRGVCWSRQRKMWRVRIKSNGKLEHLGYFDNEDEAARVYDKRSYQLNKSQGIFNFPKEIVKDQKSDSNPSIKFPLIKNTCSSSSDSDNFQSNMELNQLNEDFEHRKSLSCAKSNSECDRSNQKASLKRRKIKNSSDKESSTTFLPCFVVSNEVNPSSTQKLLNLDESTSFLHQSLFNNNFPHNGSIDSFQNCQMPLITSIGYLNHHFNLESSSSNHISVIGNTLLYNTANSRMFESQASNNIINSPRYALPLQYVPQLSSNPLFLQKKLVNQGFGVQCDQINYQINF